MDLFQGVVDKLANVMNNLQKQSAGPLAAHTHVTSQQWQTTKDDSGEQAGSEPTLQPLLQRRGTAVHVPPIVTAEFAAHKSGLGAGSQRPRLAQPSRYNKSLSPEPSEDPSEPSRPRARRWDALPYSTSSSTAQAAPRVPSSESHRSLATSTSSASMRTSPCIVSPLKSALKSANSSPTRGKERRISFENDDDARKPQRSSLSPTSSLTPTARPRTENARDAVLDGAADKRAVTDVWAESKERIDRLARAHEASVTGSVLQASSLRAGVEATSQQQHFFVL